MATLRDIRNRIKGIQNTQKITKAMKMVAAAKLRRAQENIINARPYANKMTTVLNHLITAEQKAVNPYFTERPVKNLLVVLVTADRGLCGAFNTNLIREAQDAVNRETAQGKKVSLLCIGRKGLEYFRRRGYDIAGEYTGVFAKLRFDLVSAIADQITSLFVSGSYDEVRVVYNEFKSVVSQKVVAGQFLPVPSIEKPHEQHIDIDYIYEKSQADIFAVMLPKYLRSQIWRMFLESNASEFGARMTAMDNATTNAGELIRSLKIKYNKERQASITKEILEIVSGANALNESKN